MKYLKLCNQWICWMIYHLTESICHILSIWRIKCEFFVCTFSSVGINFLIWKFQLGLCEIVSCNHGYVFFSSKIVEKEMYFTCVLHFSERRKRISVFIRVRYSISNSHPQNISCWHFPWDPRGPSFLFPYFSSDFYFPSCGILHSIS